MKKRFLATAALATTLLLGACSNKDEIKMNLSNGKENLITSDVANITRQEVFEDLVKDYGLAALLDLVDYDVLSQKYTIDETEVDDAIAMYQELYPEFDDFLLAQGFKDEADLRKYLELNLYRKEAAYSAVEVTEEEIEAAYNETYVIVEDEEETETDAEVEETEEVETPTLDEVHDDIKETLMQQKLTNDFIVETLATEREAAGFKLTNKYLEEQYQELSETYETSKETSSTVVAKTDTNEYTTEELYNELISAYGLSTGISLIDGQLLEAKYTVDKTTIKELIDQFKVAYGTNYYAFMASQGLNDDDEIYEYFKMAQLQDAALAEAYPITDEMVQASYDEMIIARHILVEDEETAKEIIAKLDAAEDKEETFKELAEEYGTDGTAADGGNLGTFGRGQMVTEFEEAAYALEEDTYSTEPVQTSFGYHVIYRTSNDEKDSFEDLKETLESNLMQQEYTSLRLEMVLINLRADANFKFTDEFLQNRYDKIVANIEENAAAEEAANNATDTEETTTEEE